MREFLPQQLVRGYNIPDKDLGTYIAPRINYLDSYSAEDSYWVRTNSMSFRMDEEVDLDPERHRVLIYGDSFTFGWGLEFDKTYFSILKESIKLEYPEIQLINAAVGGYSTGHIKKLLDRHLQKIKPSKIIYFFNNNDLIDNVITDRDYQVTRFSFSNGGKVVLDDIEPFSPLKKYLLHDTHYAWLNKNSHLFVFLKSALKSAIGWKKKLQIPELSMGKTINSSPAVTVKLPGSKFQETKIKAILSVTEAHVRRILKMVKKIKVPLLIIWVPAHEEMFPQKKHSAEHALFIRGRKLLDKLTRDSPHLKFIDTVKYIDQTPDWLEREGSLRLSDGHFNESGALWFSGVVKPFIADFIQPIPK